MVCLPPFSSINHSIDHGFLAACLYSLKLKGILLETLAENNRPASWDAVDVKAWWTLPKCS